MIDELPEACACGSRLVWAVLESGLVVPLDPEPVEDGGLTAVGMTEYLGHMRPLVRREPGGRLRSHFASCLVERPPNGAPRPRRRRASSTRG